MEHTGAPYDPSGLVREREQLHVAAAALEAKAGQIKPGLENIRSAQQLSEALHGDVSSGHFGLKTGGRKPGKNGSFSVDEAALKGLAANIERLRPPLAPRVAKAQQLIGTVLEHRAIAKLLGGYVGQLIDAAATAVKEGPEPPPGGGDRLHGQWQTTEVETGRLSCTDPSLQTLPKNPSSIRASIKAPPGSCLVACDYDQMEVRVLAHLSGDPSLISLCGQSGADLYKSVCAVWTGVQVADVTAAQRTVTKQIVLSVMYGIGNDLLETNAGLAKGEGERRKNDFYRRFASVKKFKERTERAARSVGYVETIKGRRRCV